MRPKEIRASIVDLLSSSRRDDRPQLCQSLTKRQISDLIEEMLPPNQKKIAERMVDRVGEQLEILLQEFEIICTGDRRLNYCMAPPSLIVSREEPLQVRYVGDRAYMELARELLESGNHNDSNLMDSNKSLNEARNSLEQVGLTVQTEEMLFQAVPDPAYPTEIELAMAEQIQLEELCGSVEVYVPRRADFFASRWSQLDQTASSAQSLLYRAKKSDIRSKDQGLMFLWKWQGILYRLTAQQAFFAMYKADIDRNAPKLLELDQDIPMGVIWHIPRDYARLVSRYTEEHAGQERPGLGSHDNDFMQQRRRVRPRYRSLMKTLLEDKLGINRSMR